mgnify:CR=1 FL=1
MRFSGFLCLLWGLNFDEVFALRVLLLAAVHGLTTDDLALGCANDGVFRRQDVSVHVEEEGRGRVEDARDKRGLDELKVELLPGLVAEDRVVVGQVELQVVGHAEGLSEHRLGDQRVHVVVVAGVFPEETRARRTEPLACDLELQDHLPGLAGLAQEKLLLAVGALDAVLAPALVDLDLGLVRDLKGAGVAAGRVVDV